MEILYENDDLVVCIKEPGVLSEDFEEDAGEVSPGSGFKKLDSVPAALRRHWDDPKAYVGVISRLDAPVGGVMVYAKNPKAAAWLTAELQEGTLEKEYICVCQGIPEPASGKMRDFLFKDRRARKSYPVKGRRKGAKEAILFYEVLATASCGEDGPFSLCRVRLQTGRTHQIRVQFASRRHPLPGDRKYGGMSALHLPGSEMTQSGPKEETGLEMSPAAPETKPAGLEIPSPLLYCRSLTFRPDEKSAPVSFTAKPPEAFSILFPNCETILL